jgi:DNA-directed RNA polymerase subunit N (RpoN/RPB10)
VGRRHKNDLGHIASVEEPQGPNHQQYEQHAEGKEDEEQVDALHSEALRQAHDQTGSKNRWVEPPLTGGSFAESIRGAHIDAQVARFNEKHARVSEDKTLLRHCCERTILNPVIGYPCDERHHF